MIPFFHRAPNKNSVILGIFNEETNNNLMIRKGTNNLPVEGSIYSNLDEFLKAEPMRQKGQFLIHAPSTRKEPRNLFAAKHQFTRDHRIVKGPSRDTLTKGDKTKQIAINYYTCGDSLRLTVNNEEKFTNLFVRELKVKRPNTRAQLSRNNSSIDKDRTSPISKGLQKQNFRLRSINSNQHRKSSHDTVFKRTSYEARRARKEADIFSESNPMSISNIILQVRSLTGDFVEHCDDREYCNHQESIQQDHQHRVECPREHTDLQRIVNLTNLWVAEENRPMVSFKYSIGQGNNGKLVNQTIQKRQLTISDVFWNSSNLVWCQMPSKRYSESPFSMFRVVEDKEMYTSRILELKQTFINARLYRCDDISMIDTIFERIINSPIYYFQDATLKIANHINGIKHVAKKHLLTQNVYNYARKNNMDPFSIVPETYFIEDKSLESSMIDALSQIEAKHGFSNPWIIKPGENSNRGKGIQIGIGKDDVIRKIREVSEGKKGAVILLQKYLSNPMLFKNRKFDLRCYSLVIKSRARASVYWYRRGYARTCSFEYEPNNVSNLMIHLTNEAVQVQCIVIRTNI